MEKNTELVLETENIFNCNKCLEQSIKGYKIPEINTKDIYCYNCYIYFQKKIIIDQNNKYISKNN